jgi:hypothetical protein
MLILVASCGSGGGEEPSGENALRLIQIRLTVSSLEKIWLGCQDNSPQDRIADSSSTNAVSFSSARTTKRFPSSRCASAIQIVRPLESIAETQPQLQLQLQPALLRSSAMNSQYFTSRIASLLLYTLDDKVPTTVHTNVDVVTMARWDMFNAQSQSLSKSTQFSSLASLHFCDKKARDEAWGRAGKHCSIQLP